MGCERDGIKEVKRAADLKAQADLGQCVGSLLWGQFFIVVGAFVRIREPTHDHVCVANRLHFERLLQPASGSVTAPTEAFTAVSCNIKYAQRHTVMCCSPTWYLSVSRSNPVNSRCSMSTTVLGGIVDEMVVKPLMSQNKMETPLTKSDTPERPWK